MIRNLVQNLTLAGLLFATSGCLLTSNNSVDESGMEVGDSTLRQIEPGETTEGWLIAALGEPTARKPARGPGNVEILTYSHERIHKSRGSVFLLFSGTSRKEEDTTVYFEIADGVVTKYWTEK